LLSICWNVKFLTPAFSLLFSEQLSALLWYLDLQIALSLFRACFMDSTLKLCTEKANRGQSSNMSFLSGDGDPSTVNLFSTFVEYFAKIWRLKDKMWMHWNLMGKSEPEINFLGLIDWYQGQDFSSARIFFFLFLLLRIFR
jgi:hypothetical protein